MYKKLKNAINEKDVENTYRAEILKCLPDGNITSPYGVDGLFDNSVRMLMEFKFNEGLKTKSDQCKVLIQLLYYLKKFEKAGDKFPSILFVGDVNECFFLHVNAIMSYLSKDLDWNIAPSEAHKKNQELLAEMVADGQICPFVHDIKDGFYLKEVIVSIKDISKNITRKIRLTEHNLTAIFDYFNKHVLGDKCKLSTNEKANLFIQIIINTNDNYLHPKKKNTLVTKSMGDIPIISNTFASFFKHFEGDLYSPSEKHGLTGFVDRLVEDDTRRRKGEFFTPTIWVDEAHKYIADVFGENWKDEYVVWDCAAGTCNLTRDYKFKELYCSTIEQSDIDTANQMKYNPEAIKFQYDFLNDGMDIGSDEKMPKGLCEAFKAGKKVIFLMNPPYGTANNMGTKDGDHKGGISKTKVQEIMKSDKYGAATQQLYAQFLYRIQKMKQKYGNNAMGICLFSPPLFLSGGSYEKFREKFFQDFTFQKGFLFEASNFSDVAKGWGISFTIFKTT